MPNSARQPKPLAESRAVAYYRASTSRQDKSVADQRAAVRAWAAREGFSILAEYEDDGVSAFKRDRKGRRGFDAMLNRIETEGGVDLVVAWNLDRFSRQALNGISELIRLNERGVRFADMQRGLYNLNEMGSGLSAFIDSYANEAYSKRLSANVLRGQARVRELGGWIGIIPYGYRAQKANGYVRLVVEPVEAAVVQEIYCRIGAGEPLTPIMHDLNQRGVRTRGDRLWSYNGLRNILFSVAYGGFRPTKKSPAGVPLAWVPADIERFIPGELWERVSDPYRHPRERGRRARIHPFSGLVFCGVCGAPAHILGGGSSPGSRRYRCRTYTAGVDCGAGAMASVSVDRLEAGFMRWFGELLGEKGIEEAARMAAEGVGQALAAERGAAQPLRDELAKLDDQEHRLIDLQIAGGETEILASRLAVIRSRRSHVERLLRDFGPDVRPIPLSMARNTIKRMIEDVGAVAELRPYINRVSILGRDRARVTAFDTEAVLNLGPAVAND